MMYVTVETVVGVWLFMAPPLGAGALGLKLGATFPLISLVRHWAYGAALAAIYPLARSDEDTLPATSAGPQPA